MKDVSFLNACIKEALRINSPISLLPARWTIEPVTLGKYFIPKGTSVVPNVCAVHHNPANWPEPGKFDPYRFIDTPTRPVINIPFGIGPRQCVARQFSLFEVRGSMHCYLCPNSDSDYLVLLATDITLHAPHPLRMDAPER